MKLKPPGICMLIGPDRFAGKHHQAFGQLLLRKKPHVALTASMALAILLGLFRRRGSA